MSEQTELELQRAIGRIEGKLDAFITAVSAASNVNREELQSLDDRVVRLERWRFYLAGAWAVVAVLAGLAWEVLNK